MLPDELQDQDLELTGAVSADLQEIVDSAKHELGGPVAIDDRNGRLLAHSEHTANDTDSVRMQSLLTRRAPDEAVEWVERRGVRKAEAAVVVPANERLGMEARVCAPVRFHDHFLGYLSIIDRTLGRDRNLERVTEIAQAAAVVLYREMLLTDLKRRRERKLIRDALADDYDVREDAVTQLAEHDLFVADGPVTALVARVPCPADNQSSDSTRLTVDAVMRRIRRTLAPRHGLHLGRPDHALLIVSLADPKLRARGVKVLAEHLHQELVGALTSSGDSPPIVAVGAPAAGLEHGRDSYQQALSAWSVAARVSDFGEVVYWENLGAYRLLAEFPLERLGPSVIPTGLRLLLETPQLHALVRTLECYLDHAGAAQVTADELILHRTSLYQRLHRIEELTGADLKDGDDRLALHLGLRLARLQGFSWTEDLDY